MRQHPHHYSFLMRNLGSRSVQVLQEQVGAGVYYNTGMDMDGVVYMSLIKRIYLDIEPL